MRLRMFWVICVVAAAGCLGGCERRSAALGRVTSIEANMNSLRQVPGRLQEPSGEEQPFTAYFQQMDLQMVEELPKKGSEVRSRYYYVEGKLFSYRQMRASETERQFLIDKKGLVRGVKPAAFPEEESRQVAVRAESLKQAAMERAGQMFVFPLMRNR